MEIKIRKYSKSDAQSLLGLYHDTVHTVNSKDYNTEQLQAWVPSATAGIDSWKERFAEEKALVAEADGKVVGFGTFHDAGKSIGMLYVSKDMQGKGVGKAILKKLEKKLKKKDVENARAEVSVTARTFFEKCGYHWVRDNRKVVNGQDFVNFIMEKELIEKKVKMPKEKENKPSDNWSSIFKQKFIDLIIVIVGVSAAFQLNNIKNESDQKALEQFYYESLLTDINKDIESITFIVQSLKGEREMVSAYLKKLETPGTLHDSLGVVLVRMLELESFSGNDNTYRTLLSSNGLNTFKDRNIRRQITDYYRLYAFVQRFQDVQTKFILEFYNYITPFCDISKMEITDTMVYEKVETKNYMTTFAFHLSSGIEDYEETLTRAKDLKKAVEAQVLKY